MCDPGRNWTMVVQNSAPQNDLEKCYLKVAPYDLQICGWFPCHAQLLFRDDTILFQHFLSQVFHLFLVHTPDVVELTSVCCLEMPDEMMTTQIG